MNNNDNKSKIQLEAEARDIKRLKKIEKAELKQRYSEGMFVKFSNGYFLVEVTLN